MIDCIHWSNCASGRTSFPAAAAPKISSAAARRAEYAYASVANAQSAGVGCSCTTQNSRGDWSLRGPELWADLHRWALDADHLTGAQVMARSFRCPHPPAIAAAIGSLTSLHIPRHFPRMTNSSPGQWIATIRSTAALGKPELLPHPRSLANRYVYIHLSQQLPGIGASASSSQGSEEQASAPG